MPCLIKNLSFGSDIQLDDAVGNVAVGCVGPEALQETVASSVLR